jgi:hypothetical protein
MMQQIISQIATCTIFWAPDFKYWRHGVDAMYFSQNIQGFSNYGIFHGLNSHSKPNNIFDFWDIK